MKKKAFILGFIVYLLTGLRCEANDFRIAAYAGSTGFFYPPYDFTSSNLQQSPGLTYEAEGTYFFGEEKGPWIGIMYSGDRTQYGQNAINGRPHDNIQTDNYYLMGEAGYWLKFKSESVLEFGIAYGPGHSNVWSSLRGGAPSETIDTGLLEIKADIDIPISIGATKIDAILGGVGCGPFDP